jgi:hypothetical protein
MSNIVDRVKAILEQAPEVNEIVDEDDTMIVFGTIIPTREEGESYHEWEKRAKSEGFEFPESGGLSQNTLEQIDQLARIVGVKAMILVNDDEGCEDEVMISFD